MDLVVVATLLNKVPNFAHLTRTSEIFDVSQLVIPNIKLLDDENYKTISVSSDKWMNIIEVTEENLVDYLKYKKLCGYSVRNNFF